MNTQNRKPRNIRFAGTLGAILAGVLLAANLALAISAYDTPNRRRQALREAQLRSMDQFAQSYASTDWSAVGAAVAGNPLAAENPRIFSIFLSLGNVFLNRYEVGHSQADLDRAMGYFEMVAGNEDLWGSRPLAGSVVVYLGVSLVRLDAECDVGASADRIEAFRNRVAEIAAAEADVIAPLEEYASLVATTEEADAARAGIYATAAVLIADDARSSEWRRDAESLAAALSSSGSTSAETALTMSQAELMYEASGDVPRSFGGFAPSKALVVAFRGPGSVAVEMSKASPAVAPETLETPIQDSRATAAMLSAYLRQFPPGSQCETFEEGSSRSER